jgi:hypothetical protein
MTLVLRHTGTQQIQVPPGLGAIQRELAALTSRFFRLATHNWAAFGAHYGRLVEEAFCATNRQKQGEESEKSGGAGYKGDAKTVD